jgi:hypothetical protein
MHTTLPDYLLRNKIEQATKDFFSRFTMKNNKLKKMPMSMLEIEPDLKLDFIKLKQLIVKVKSDNYIACSVCTAIK